MDIIAVLEHYKYFALNYSKLNKIIVKSCESSTTECEIVNDLMLLIKFYQAKYIIFVILTHWNVHG